MELRNIKKGDKIYAVYNRDGHLFYDDIKECIINKVVTKDFTTIIYFDCKSDLGSKKAVGYYRGSCATNEDWCFFNNKIVLESEAKRTDKASSYEDLLWAKKIITDFIKEVS